MDKRGWERINNRLPKTHVWEYSFAIKEERKGRAKGGVLIGKKKDWGTIKKLNVKEEEGLVLSEIKKRKEKLVIIAVYNRKGWKETEEKINKMVEEKDLENIIVGGYFNIKTGGIGLEEGGMERKSKDKKIGNEGNRLVNWVQEKGWNILNGTTIGD